MTFKVFKLMQRQKRGGGMNTANTKASSFTIIEKFTHGKAKNIYFV